MSRPTVWFEQSALKAAEIRYLSHRRKPSGEYAASRGLLLLRGRPFSSFQYHSRNPDRPRPGRSKRPRDENPDLASPYHAGWAPVDDSHRARSARSGPIRRPGPHNRQASPAGRPGARPLNRHDFGFAHYLAVVTRVQLPGQFCTTPCGMIQARPLLRPPPGRIQFRFLSQTKIAVVRRWLRKQSGAGARQHNLRTSPRDSARR